MTKILYQRLFNFCLNYIVFKRIEIDDSSLLVNKPVIFAFQMP